MNLIFIRGNESNSSNGSLLRFALTSRPIAGLVLEGLGRCLTPSDVAFAVPASRHRPGFGKTVYAVPKGWNVDPGALEAVGETTREYSLDRAAMVQYERVINVPSEARSAPEPGAAEDPWLVVSNGRFATKMDMTLLHDVLAGVKADVVAVSVDSSLLGEREEVRLTAEGKVAAFHRVYKDSAEFAFASTDWPHHLLVRTCVVEKICPDGVLPWAFSDLLDRCRERGLVWRGVNIGGTLLDLESHEGLVSFCGISLSDRRTLKPERRSSRAAPEGARLVGDVLLGSDVSIAPDVVIVGPTIIGDGVSIESGAVVSSSIVAPGLRISANKIVQDRIVGGPQHDRRRRSHRADPSQGVSRLSHDFDCPRDPCRSFRRWSRLSYARCLKRVADCFVAVVILLLFAPLMPFVALAIKLTSPGPVFYKDRRQGLHGKDFGCLKFRTMITGAHEIQEKLRIVSQVDGPQFKMEDDPRISTVGRFLRETYIDEIPQFFNVLLGQMSVVGPRPSPESENTLCPLWRDARLSVRPGITGLWQVHRTRQPMRDFQEWIHYDIEYVRNLSLRMDLAVCWQTTKKLLDNFISQF
ncbi:MAG: sugar transferase [Sedimentisphaerales bacterium]|jgi:lipopolysaccharide/colanic/teichoic acid biosynthesis glycosyltransferase